MRLEAGATVLYRRPGAKRAARYLVERVEGDRVVLYYTSPAARGGSPTPRHIHVPAAAVRLLAVERSALARLFAQREEA